MPFIDRWKHGGTNLGSILLGVLAFLLGPTFELVSIKGMRFGKQIIALTALVLLGCAARGVCLYPGRFTVPAWTAVLSWLLLAASAVLLVYSLCIEIPFVQTYHSPGVGKRLITRGTYALVRHPGVLWFAMLVAALALVSRSRLALIAAPIWTGADMLYAWIQDRYLFPLMFPDYAEYQRKVPMFIPTRASLRRCLHTLGREKDRDD